MDAPHVPSFELVEKKSQILLNGLVISALAAIYAITVGMSIWLVMVAATGAALLLVLQFLFQNIQSNLTHGFTVSAILSALCCTVALIVGIAPLLLIIPVFVYCIGFRDRSTYLIPVVSAVVAELFTTQTSSITVTVTAACVLLLSLKINHTLTLLKKALADKEGLLQQYQQCTLAHTSFLRRLTRGEYQIKNDFQQHDALGNLLFEFGTKIQAATEQEQRKSWQMHGLNELNTIIRSSGNLDGRYDVLLSFLVKYMKANQGGLFIINDGNNLELKACYAYEKNRIVNKQIPIGESMLGQCVLENETLYIEKIPANYVNITSGLGLATPSCLVMVPIQYNDRVLGVIELASFKKMERYQLEFLERASEIIGGALLSFQSSALTKRMLEESQQLSEELRTQQEEVRQNMEELEATQEHLLREGKEREKLQQELSRSKEFLNLVIDSVPVPVFVKNRNHEMVLVNKAVCDLNGLSRDEMIGKSDHDFFPKEQADVFRSMEAEIFKSKKVTEKLQRVTRHGQETMSIDKKIVIETQAGECFLVGINIDVTNSPMQPGAQDTLVAKSA